MMDIGLYHYLFMGLFLFILGLSGSILCSNIIKILICIEIMLTGININFVSFSKFCGGIDGSGYVITLFYTGIGAVELAVALYIFYFMYTKKQSSKLEKYGDL